VAGHEGLASAVAHLVARLSAALTLGTAVATEAIAVAAELARLAAETPPPPAAGKSRVAFWK